MKYFCCYDIIILTIRVIRAVTRTTNELSAEMAKKAPCGLMLFYSRMAPGQFAQRHAGINILNNAEKIKTDKKGY